ncbi:MAG: class I tRNA ligase family protein [Armatimonadetes bacterium]|nr:class I tRNA ligase family protein [Armatimonadota bacterium]
MFKEVKTTLNFPETERKILEFWETNRIFEKLRQKNAGNAHWSFIDGPITANNPMGVHHAWGRTYKDIFQRFKAMQGFDQRYQNGFDCQGLWVEVEVEKELGLNSKREILAYGLDKFAEACRARVQKYSAIQTEQSKRLGQWMDWENSYYTMTDTNIEYIWHFLKKCHQNGWLYKGQRAMPWCIRCGTSLSQHELIDSYRDMTHTSVFVKLPILDRDGEYMMVWTTTPWTLTANTALAVHPELDYAKVKQGDDILYLSAGTVSKLDVEYEIVATVKGSELIGLRYKGPFFDLPCQQGLKTTIVPWEDVGEEEGVGVVHIAPGCGAEDFELSQTLGLPVLVPIDENGIYYREYGWLEGKSVAEVAPLIFQDLKRKGMLYKTEDYEHRYPVCWRCHEELVFRLVDEWFISCKELRQPMIEAARTVRWVPDYAGKRMEDWLNNMGDWCISRKRFWGLPLPFYKCECGEMTIIGSRKELEERLAYQAGHDPLTDLANRTHLRAVLELAWQDRRAEGTLGVLFVDLDRLKEINDLHGHEAGNEVLKAVAAEIRSAVRATDLAARYGGDEFVVLLTRTDVPGATRVAEALRAGVERVGQRLGYGSGQVTVSIGIAEYDPASPPTGSLLVEADRALYMAKAAGRNVVMRGSL